MDTNQKSALESLSPREREVCDYCKKGLDRQRIADAMVISRNTVDGYFKSIHAKLRVKTHGELMRLLYEEDRQAA